MNQLSQTKVVTISGSEPALTAQEIDELLPQVPGWKVIDQDGEKRLVRSYSFENFSRALAFTDKVGQLAEQEDHHPSLLTEWGKVTVTWWTHKIRGLHQNDFIMAAKTQDTFEQKSF